MTKDEALKMALEALEENHEEIVHNWALFEKNKNAIHAIKEALSQPEQEPVAWITPDGEGFRIRFSPPVNDVPLGWDALYTTQPQRKPMTYEEIEDLYFKFSMGELKDLPETLKLPTELRSKT